MIRDTFVLGFAIQPTHIDSEPYTSYAWFKYPIDIGITMLMLMLMTDFPGLSGSNLQLLHAGYNSHEVFGISLKLEFEQLLSPPQVHYAESRGTVEVQLNQTESICLCNILKKVYLYSLMIKKTILTLIIISEDEYLLHETHMSSIQCY